MTHQRERTGCSAQRWAAYQKWEMGLNLVPLLLAQVEAPGIQLGWLMPFTSRTMQRKMRIHHLSAISRGKSIGARQACPRARACRCRHRSKALRDIPLRLLTVVRGFCSWQRRVRSHRTALGWSQADERPGSSPSQCPSRRSSKASLRISVTGRNKPAGNSPHRDALPPSADGRVHKWANLVRGIGAFNLLGLTRAQGAFTNLRVAAYVVNCMLHYRARSRI